MILKLALIYFKLLFEKDKKLSFLFQVGVC